MVFISLKYEFFTQKTKKALEIRTFFVSTNVDVYGGDEGECFCVSLCARLSAIASDFLSLSGALP